MGNSAGGLCKPSARIWDSSSPVAADLPVLALALPLQPVERKLAVSRARATAANETKARSAAAADNKFNFKSDNIGPDGL